MLDYYDNGDTLFDVADIFLNCCKVKATPLHAHSFVEIAFVAEGEGVHIIGELEYPCKKGEVYLINHDVPHKFISNSTNQFVIYNCAFKADFFDFSMIDSRIFYDITYNFLMNSIRNEAVLKTTNVTLSEENYSVFFSIYEEMLHEYTSKGEGYLSILKADLIRLIVLILRTMKKEKNRLNSSSHKNQLLEKAIDYIHSNFDKDITLEELSMQAFISQSHFCRLFKEYSGITVKEFTQRIRINEACRLLKTTNKKVADIAFEIGYLDVKHFNSLFKKLMGRTPNEYRKAP